MTTKPTILFIHGSWHTPAHFQRIRNLFESHGYPTSCPLHPSIDHLPPTGLKEDAQCIRNEVRQLVNDHKKEVIAVAHSYGGIVATEALDQESSIKSRASKGLKGGVVHLIYMCAFLLPVGKSLATALGGLPPWIPIDKQGMCTMLNPQERFYSDLPPNEQDYWVSQLRFSPAVTQTTAITYAAYRYHPSTYLFCEDDRALPLQMQQVMVRQVNEELTKEGNLVIETESCSAGHSPFLSQPNTVLGLVEKVLGK